MRRLAPLSVAAILLCGGIAVPRAERQAVRFVFTSDAHNGITRTHFRGADAVPATVVNRALVDAVNRAGPLDFVVEGGDVANREEETELGPIQSTFNHGTDRVQYSRTVGGVHFVFMTVWPDSTARAWLETDLRFVGRTMPVVVFTHDQPEAQAKHFTNPNGTHDINATDKFENLLSERLADGATIEAPTVIEQRALERFLERHPNISAWFHGNSNWNEFYEWSGPDRSVALNVFRVDSPIKGAISADDERRLSFHVATIDTATLRMTVRECLWNSEPSRPSAPLKWGESITVGLDRLHR